MFTWLLQRCLKHISSFVTYNWLGITMDSNNELTKLWHLRVRSVPTVRLPGPKVHVYTVYWNPFQECFEESCRAPCDAVLPLWIEFLLKTDSRYLFFFLPFTIQARARACIFGKSVAFQQNKILWQTLNRHYDRKRSRYLSLGSVNLVLKLMGAPDGISTRSGWNRVSRWWCRVAPGIWILSWLSLQDE